MVFSTALFLKKIQGYDQARLSLWSPVALGLGISFYFLCKTEPSFAVGALVLTGGTGLLFWGRRQQIMRLVFMICLGFFISILARSLYGTPMLDWPFGATRVEGTVHFIEPHGENGEGLRLVLDAPKIENLPAPRTPKSIRLSLRPNLVAKAKGIEAGSHFTAIARLLPYSAPVVPGGFDFRRHAFFQGLGATGYAMGKIEIGQGSAPDPSLWYNRSREKILRMIKTTLKGDQAGLAAIFLAGEKSLLSPETTDAMRSIGLAHLLAIAGLHIGLVAGIVFWLVRTFLAFSERATLTLPIKKIAAMAALFAIAAYSLQVGAPVPTRRAFVMAGLFLVGIMVDRVSLSMRTLSLAAFVLLLLWPFLLFNPGFQLSFAAVSGLISVSELLRERTAFSEKRGFFRRARSFVLSLLGMSFVAMVATLPFGLYHFQEAETYSVLSNALAIPLTSFLIMPLCVLVYLAWPFGLEVYPLQLLGKGFGLLISLSHTIRNLPAAKITLPPLGTGWLVICTGGLLFFCLTKGRKRYVGLPVLGIGLVCGLLFAPSPAFFASADGQTIGWIVKKTETHPETLYVSTFRRRPDHFLEENWAHAAGLSTEQVKQAGEQDIVCEDGVCRPNLPWGRVAWVKDPAAVPALCAQSFDLILNPNDDTVCASGSPVWTFERFTTQGALSLFRTGAGIKILTTRKRLGQRVWSIGYKS